AGAAGDYALVCLIPAHAAESLAPVEITEWSVPYPDSRPRDPFAVSAQEVWFAGQRAERGAAGTLAACDERSEALATKARSTAAGSDVGGEGGVDWCLAWQAPEAIAGAIRLILWANAANGDDSPFGDRIYRLDTSIGPAAKNNRPAGGPVGRIACRSRRIGMGRQAARATAAPVCAGLRITRS
ncbi:MAG: hypothetical protein ACE5ED_13295, partial [Rhodothalassiaceae bacterium]